MHRDKEVHVCAKSMDNSTVLIYTVSPRPNPTLFWIYDWWRGANRMSDFLANKDRGEIYERWKLPSFSALVKYEYNSGSYFNEHFWYFYSAYEFETWSKRAGLNNKKSRIYCVFILCKMSPNVFIIFQRSENQRCFSFEGWQFHETIFKMCRGKSVTTFTHHKWSRIENSHGKPWWNLKILVNIAIISKSFLNKITHI